MKKIIYTLAIESSCDDTSAAILKNEILLSNVMASQDVHKKYGGVVPELASRAHLQNILPVVSEAIRQAGITKEDIDNISFTRGPGLLGSLIVGVSFAKGLSLALNKPLVEVNHLHGHILSHFIQSDPDTVREVPKFPFIALLVSGGHSMLVKVKSTSDFEVLGQSIDDAVGEAFDKCAKVLGLGYPGGPVIDKLAHLGDPKKFKFAKPHVGDMDFSFSGVKTSLLYFLRDRMKEDQNFIKDNINDICASYQRTLIDILLKKLSNAVKYTGIKTVAIGGGVSANSELRDSLAKLGKEKGWKTFIPERRFTTDNAAMIGITGYFKFLEGVTCELDVTPISRVLNYKL